MHSWKSSLFPLFYPSIIIEHQTPRKRKRKEKETEIETPKEEPVKSTYISGQRKLNSYLWWTYSDSSTKNTIEADDDAPTVLTWESLRLHPANTSLDHISILCSIIIFQHHFSICSWKITCNAVIRHNELQRLWLTNYIALPWGMEKWNFFTFQYQVTLFVYLTRIVCPHIIPRTFRSGLRPLDQVLTLMRMGSSGKRKPIRAYMLNLPRFGFNPKQSQDESSKLSI